MNAIDTSAKTTGQAQQIVDAGYEAVGVYLRPDRCDAAMLAELHDAGVKVWSVYEKGFPTTDGYFTAARGTFDGTRAADFTTAMGQPQGSQIYAAVDYDPSTNAVSGPISAYMQAFQAAIEQAGYLSGVYGSGRTCRILLASGLAKTGWLTQSTGFAEYNAFKPQAGIVQLPEINANWDGDEIPDPTVVGLW
jgi:hypothetical protein